MHAPPRERLFIVIATAAVIGGVVLASDDDHWMTSSLCLTLGAVVASLLARFVDDHRIEQVAAVMWWATLAVGARWITLPAVWIPLAVVTVVGLPIVVRTELRVRRAEIRSARTRCVECDYDLRATAERCPECGTPINPEVDRLRRIAAELRAARSPGYASITPPSSSTPIPVDASDVPQ